MAKATGLPSVDDFEEVKEEPKRKTQPAEPERIESIGHLSRSVDLRLTGGQPLKFKRIMRHLEDSGATLADGSAVTNKRRAALWLIENFELPKSNR